MRWLTFLAVSCGLAPAILAADPVVLKAARMFDGKSDHLITPGWWSS